MQMWLEESLLCCIKELDVSLKTACQRIPSWTRMSKICTRMDKIYDLDLSATLRIMD